MSHRQSFESTALRYGHGKLTLLDQTLLPHEEYWITVNTLETVIESIQSLRVRGAPLIGVAAAFFLARLQFLKTPRRDIENAASRLREARPTAVNLAAAVDFCLGAPDIEAAALQWGLSDQEMCERIALHGFTLIPQDSNIFTICNAGALATAGIGTALGVIRKAWESGRRFHVYVPETRPLGQGARLTTWELERAGIPYTLICDNMVGSVLARKGIAAAFVGADRIAANGDFANKIGTYNMAILCRHHNVPLYVAAPLSTVDRRCPNGVSIPVEERGAAEVRGMMAPRNCTVYNPAFDVTPASLTTGWILDAGLCTDNTSFSSLINEAMPG